MEIYEPNQDAIIAWNGQKEILLLSTSLRASAETTLLEVLPLPSQPEVKLGDRGAFRRATRIINRHLAAERGAASRARPRGRPDMKDAGDAGDDAPIAELVQHRQIGAHDLSVVKVLRAGRFAG